MRALGGNETDYNMSAPVLVVNETNTTTPGPVVNTTTATTTPAPAVKLTVKVGLSISFSGNKPAAEVASTLKESKTFVSGFKKGVVDMFKSKPIDGLEGGVTSSMIEVTKVSAVKVEAAAASTGFGSRRRHLTERNGVEVEAVRNDEIELLEVQQTAEKHRAGAKRRRLASNYDVS